MSVEQQIAKEVVRLLKEEGLVIQNGSQQAPVMSVKEAAKYLNRSVTNIREMIASGAIPHHVHRKFGSRTMLIRAELDRWLKQCST